VDANAVSQDLANSLHSGNHIVISGVSRIGLCSFSQCTGMCDWCGRLLPSQPSSIFFFLLVATVYSAYSLARIAIRLRQLLKHAASTSAKDVSSRLIEMTSGMKTLRQFHTLLFLFFGICCANEVFATLRAIQYSSMSLSAARIDVFEPVVAFAFFVFVVLLFLHVFQWAVAHRLQTTVVND